MTGPAVVATPNCPACGGGWLYSLTFAHLNGCPLRAADDGCRAADAEALADWPSLVRPATSTEQTLATVLGWPGPAAEYGPTATKAEVLCLVWGPASLARRQLRTDWHGTPGRVWDPDTPTATPETPTNGDDQ